ncbi:hypothetical protein BC7_00066 [Bacillus phage BC-7]|nr:hypothetical protein BC7_00066 [Bacillus phage BC-7]
MNITHERANTWGSTYKINPLPQEKVILTRERDRHGLVHMKQIKRLTGVKKPIADLSTGELFLRDFKFMSMLHRVQSLENKFSHDYGIYEVLEVHDTGEIFRSYFECHLVPKFDASMTLSGVKKNAF